MNCTSTCEFLAIRTQEGQLQRHALSGLGCQVMRIILYHFQFFLTSWHESKHDISHDVLLYIDCRVEAGDASDHQESNWIRSRWADYLCFDKSSSSCLWTGSAQYLPQTLLTFDQDKLTCSCFDKSTSSSLWIGSAPYLHRTHIDLSTMLSSFFIHIRFLLPSFQCERSSM